MKRSEYIPSKVEIYDSTLRDGAQSVGISFSLEDKLLITSKLDEMGFHYIEGGYPNSTNPKDSEFFRLVGSLGLKNSKVVAFGSTRRHSNKPERDTGLRSLLDAETEIVTIFGKTWDMHVKDVLRISLDDNLRLVEDSVLFLRREGRRVFFDAEHFFDGFLSNKEFALKVLKAAEDGGAELVVLCDTNGGGLPDRIAEACETVRLNLGIPFGVHCHNDSGLSAANTVAAVSQGAVQVQGTINGIGERCGNDNLCTSICNISLKLGIPTIPEESLSGLTGLSLFVSEIVNEFHNHRQPYVGDSAFTHKGGAHVDGVVKNPITFEHVDPFMIGNKRRLLLSDQSGASAVMAKLEGIYPELDKKGPRVRAILHELKKKEHEGYQYEAAQGSFELLAAQIVEGFKPPFQLGGFRVVTDRRNDGSMISEATIKVTVDGEDEHTASEGHGPVDALNGALRKALVRFYPSMMQVRLEDYKVRVLESNKATEARVRVLIESSNGVETWGTVGVSENVIEASYIALADSLSYQFMLEERKSGKRKIKE